jgi:hypothetical protein
VRDTHKRKVQFVLPKAKEEGKKVVASDDETESGGKSPIYQEFINSSLTTSSDDGGVRVLAVLVVEVQYIKSLSIAVLRHLLMMVGWGC